MPPIGTTISKESFNQKYAIGSTLSKDQFDSYNRDAPENKRFGIEPPEFVKQMGAGVLSTLGGLTEFGRKIGQFAGVDTSQTKQILDRVQQITEPYKGTPGFITEQIGEFMVPVGKVAQGAKLLTKAGAQALEFAGKTAAQTGGDPFEAATSGAIGAAFPVLGAVSDKIGLTKFVTKTLPERFFNSFFKTSVDDFEKYVRSGGLEKLRRDSPEMFKYLQEIGVVRKSILKSGKVEINPTLAREALERGMGTAKTGRGLETMAEYSYMKQFELEAKAQTFARNSGKMVELTKSQLNSYVSLLQNLQDEFKALPGASSFMRDEINKIGGIRNRIIEALDIAAEKGSKPKLGVGDALTLRRELDILRNSSSFITNPKLGSMQGLYKNAAEQMRSKLKMIPELEKIMDEYRFYIESGDSLTRELAQRTRGRILGLQDAILGGTSMAGGFPAQGLGLATAIRTIQLPAVMMMIGRGLYSLPETAPKLKIPSIITSGVQQIQR